MTDTPPVYIILTTYKRTEVALKTIRGIKNNLQWSNIGWIVTDDGSPPEHMEAIKKEIGGSYTLHIYDSAGKGVGHGMNWAINKIKELGAKLFIMCEDDWELLQPLDFKPYVRLLMEHESISMIRMGYLSYGISGELFPAVGKLWFKLFNTGFTYTFSGHASLRHLRFHEQYGMYKEGLVPGLTELSMCGQVNAKPDGPVIVWPIDDFGASGPFVHIGSESLADEEVRNK